MRWCRVSAYRGALTICAALFLSAVLGEHIPARASSNATLFGLVTDTQKRPLSDVSISLSGVGIPEVHTVTDGRGYYRIPTIYPFTVYSLAARHPDFGQIEYAGLQFETGETRRVNFRLKRPGEREVVVLTTRDPYPHENLVHAFLDKLDVPVRIVDLDEMRDAADAVRRIGAEKPNLILGAGTTAAMLIRRDIKDIPAILVLVDEFHQRELQSTNLCFISHHPTASDILDRVLAVLPETRTIGLVYDAHASWRFARDLSAEAGLRGLGVELGPTYSQRHLRKSLEAMPTRIDVLIVPFDPITLPRQSSREITRWALTNRVPLAVPHPDWVKQGALFSYGVPLEEIGREALHIADLILNEERQPSDFDDAILVHKGHVFSVNEETALAIGIETPSLPPLTRDDPDQ